MLLQVASLTGYSLQRLRSSRSAAAALVIQAEAQPHCGSD
jgi:hypothetical protein